MTSLLQWPAAPVGCKPVPWLTSKRAYPAACSEGPVTLALNLSPGTGRTTSGSGVSA